MYLYFFQALLILIILVIPLWIVSVIRTNASIVDIFWGTGFVVINAYYFLVSGEHTMLKWITLVLITLWGLRLSLYIGWRNWGKGEDFRYRKFRQDYGPKRYWWISFFQVFLLQGVLLWIISITLFGINFYSTGNAMNLLTYAGFGFWLIGFVFEAGGDLQLARFRKDPSNKGKVLEKGFWKYTRHPNYFGDAAVWWGYALVSISVGAYWHCIGSIVMTFLLVRVSGVFLLEKTMRSKPGYEDYIRRTRAFVPWVPKKTK